ncbi:MAG: hypothetical protein HY921_08180 [Elusimicrobia bacterium]|nr:hypothetical protein [Elusimicrobiota bacterium]
MINLLSLALLSGLGMASAQEIPAVGFKEVEVAAAEYRYPIIITMNLAQSHDEYASSGGFQFRQSAANRFVETILDIPGFPLGKFPRTMHEETLTSFPGDGKSQGSSQIALSPAKDRPDLAWVKVSRTVQGDFDEFRFYFKVDFSAEARFTRGSWQDFEAGHEVALELTPVGKQSADRAFQGSLTQASPQMHQQFENYLAKKFPGNIKLGDFISTIKTSQALALYGSKSKLKVSEPETQIKVETGML